MMDPRRAQVITEAEKWVGTPFHNSAMVLGAGVACGPLLVSVYNAVGIEVPAFESLPLLAVDWALHTQEERYLEVIERFTHRVEVPRPGDVLMVSWGLKRPFAHSAIVVDWPHRVIHSMWRGVVEYADASQPPLRKTNRRTLFLSPFQD